MSFCFNNKKRFYTKNQKNLKKKNRAKDHKGTITNNRNNADFLNVNKVLQTSFVFNNEQYTYFDHKKN